MVAGRHEQSDTPPTCNTRNGPAWNEAVRRRGSLTTRFDRAMSWEAAPAGRRGRQQTHSDTAIPTWLTMKGEGRAEDSPVDGFRP